MSDDPKNLPSRSNSTDIDAFLDQVRQAPPARPEGGRGRLVFALDATASREPTWDRACRLQGEMFEATAGLGGLEIQLVFYRGFAECKASRWLTSAAELHAAMRKVHCVGGQTQIERILSHAIRETQQRRVNALIFVGDAMEENVDRLCREAGELGLLGVPIFLFHEGRERIAAAAFRQMATLSHGAYLSFDDTSAGRLKELLGAVAVYAAGGYRALADYGRGKSSAVLQLTSQLKG
jgi:hypothetical protein